MARDIARRDADADLWRAVGRSWYRIHKQLGKQKQIPPLCKKMIAGYIQYNMNPQPVIPDPDELE